jgi:hypothetical protein
MCFFYLLLIFFFHTLFCIAQDVLLKAVQANDHALVKSLIEVLFPLKNWTV